MGFSQSSLARELNTGQSTISRWLAGAKPQPRSAKDLAAALCVRVKWLLDGEEPMELDDVQKAMAPSVRYGGRRISSVRPSEVPKAVSQELERSALNNNELSQIREAVLLRDEIDRRLDALVSSPQVHGTTTMQSLIRRVEEFHELCDMLTPKSADALRDELARRKQSTLEL